MAQNEVKLEYPVVTRPVQTDSITEHPDSTFPALGKFHTSHPNASNQLRFEKASTSTGEEGSELNYKPKPVLLESYDKYFDELGFANDPDKRAEFVAKIHDHVDGSVFRYLRENEKPKEFEKMVRGFLEKYGEVYWGATCRRHLIQQDTENNFCALAMLPARVLGRCGTLEHSNTTS